MTTSGKDILSTVDVAPELDDGKMCLAKAKVSLTGMSDIGLASLSDDIYKLDFGKKIKIEPIRIDKTTTEQVPEKSNDYTITKGDNLTKIAKANNTTVSELVKLNGIKNPDKILIGQKIKLHADVPKVEEAVVAPSAKTVAGNGDVTTPGGNEKLIRPSISAEREPAPQAFEGISI